MSIFINGKTMDEFIQEQTAEARKEGKQMNKSESQHRYRISSYVSESPTYEGIMWTRCASHESADKKEILKRFNQLSATAHKNPRNIMRISQSRKTEEQALNSLETSMRSETWECYSENGSRYWYRITMYVLIPGTY